MGKPIKMNSHVACVFRFGGKILPFSSSYNLLYIFLKVVLVLRKCTQMLEEVISKIIPITETVKLLL